jgi:hypothetical protein
LSRLAARDQPLRIEPPPELLATPSSAHPTVQTLVQPAAGPHLGRRSTDNS